MTTKAFQELIGAARRAYGAQVSGPRAQASLARIFASIDDEVQMQDVAPARLPACDHFEAVAQPEKMPNAPLRELMQAIRDIEPQLRWAKRGGSTAGANAAYEDGHANAVLLGAGGLATAPHVWMGLSLLAPGVRYPDHDHPPEETYLVLSEGDFAQDNGDWFTPGIGGTFYNRPGILHAMRSGETPLLAMWALWSDV